MIGCGSFARASHGPAQVRCRAEMPGLELAACCDVVERHAADYARDFGYARHYCDVEAMLTAEKPAAVVLAVPPSATCAAASPVLERGLPLLLEKPPGLTTAELDRLEAAAQKGGAGAQVAFNRRYMPVLRKAREMLAGMLLDANARVDYAMDRFDRWDADFSTTAVHGLDAMLFLAGSPLAAAELRFQTVRQGPRETANVILDGECVSGCRVSLSLRPVTAFNVESALVHATGQALKISFAYPPSPNSEGTVEHWRANDLAGSYSDSECDVVEKLGVFAETRAFLEAVRSGGGYNPTLAECRQQVALMEAIRLRRTGVIRFAAS